MVLVVASQSRVRSGGGICCSPLCYLLVTKTDFYRNSALLAHSVEHFHGKEEVVGSIPTEGS